VEAAVLKILGAAPQFLLLPHNLDVMHIAENGGQDKGHNEC
jgi:hypothetical protein